MLEGKFTQKLLKALRAHPVLHNRAYIQKHVNYYSSGVPDFSVSLGAKTLWVEVKIVGNNCTPLQEYNLKLLGKGGLLLVADQDGKYGFLYPLNSCTKHSFEGLIEQIVVRLVNA